MLVVLSTCLALDVLVLSFEGEQRRAEIEAALAPVELVRDHNGMWAVEGVVSRHAHQPGQGDVTLEFHALGADGATRSAVLTQPSAWWQVANEVDTLWDLALLFGVPGKGVRTGSRRHVQALIDALASGDRTTDMRFLGEAPRWIAQRPWSEEELAELRALGGTWSEYRVATDVGLPIRELVAMVAADRRRHHLEPGFERAAVALLRGWLEGVDAGQAMAGAWGERCASARQAWVAAVVQSLWESAPNVLYAYDSAAVQAAFVRHRDGPFESEALRAAAAAELDTSLTAEANGKRGRSQVHDPRSGVDPSEIAAVWLDVLLASGLLEGEDALAWSDREPLVGALFALATTSEAPDVRRNDHIDLRPHVQQLTDALFAARGEPDSGEREALFEVLWSHLLRSSPKSLAEARRRAWLVGVAGWGTASGIDDKAQRLLAELTRAAEGLAGAEEVLSRAKPTNVERARARVASWRRGFEGWMAIAVAMRAAEPRGGVAPAASIEAQFNALADGLEGAARPSPGVARLLEEWRGGR
ncbi:MAG: hypothetical protein R3F49_23080 [Planctomycetota bacterium]